MVIDSSALVAILLGEPEAERLTPALAADPVRCISAFSLLETSVVLYRRKGAEAVAELGALLADLGVESEYWPRRRAWASSERSDETCSGGRIAG